MFTGIIEDLGKITKLTDTVISLESSLDDIKVGDSIAVNGICLTVSAINKSILAFDISPETLKKTSLSILNKGDFVNLERAMKAQSRFGGHIVTGHIETTSKINKILKTGDSYILTFDIPESLSKFIVEKGSITVDGISLTVAEIKNSVFSIAVIPHTFKNTNLKFKKIRDIVNLEPDILAKYLDNINKHNSIRNLSKEFLKENGF